MDERELIYDWNRAGGAASFDWTRARVDLNDETLRDALQSPSVRDPALNVKKRLLHLMADLGIVAADIGLPGAGPRVVEQVRALAMETRDAQLPLAPNCLAASESAVHGVRARALGVGERVGNAEMDLLIVNLRLLGAHRHAIAKLPEYCRLVADAVGVPIP